MLGEIFSREDILKLWPQGKQELLQFAKALHNSKSQITAGQIMMAIQLAEQAFLQIEQAEKDAKNL